MRDCSTASKVFDPLGFVNPLAVRSKLFIRTLHKENLSGEQKIPEELKHSWVRIADDYNSHINKLSVPRKALNNDMPFDLIIFADAGKDA